MQGVRLGLMTRSFEEREPRAGYHIMLTYNIRIFFLWLLEQGRDMRKV